MTEESTPAGEVSIGDQKVTVERFSVFKVIEATTIVTTIMEEVPQLGEKISDFTRDYRAKHSVTISRAAAELRYSEEELSKISETAWEAGNQQIEIPASPGPIDVAAHVFPDVFRVAREEVLRLVALVVIPNSELEDADLNGDVAEELDKKARMLRHKDAGDLLDVLAVTAEVLGAQFEGKAEALGPIAKLVGFRSETEEESVVEVRPSDQADQTDQTDSTESSSKPTTSTPSPGPTDGPEPSRSTGSPSSTPAVSGAA